jgi:hypothetical protein
VLLVACGDARAAGALSAAIAKCGDARDAAGVGDLPTLVIADALARARDTDGARAAFALAIDQS